MMNRRNWILSLSACIALVGGAALLGAAAETAKTAKVGEAAPAFTLNDSAGKSHSLKDFAGKTVVLEWINPECPFCIRVYEQSIIKNTIEEMKKIDPNAVYLAVNSTNFQGPEVSAAWMKKHGLESVPALVDQDGTVGHLYDAKTTPHIFIIDGKGVLRYQGALDDDARGSKAEKKEPVTNYVINTLRQLKAGETVSPDQTKPWGCSVKYKKS